MAERNETIRLNFDAKQTGVDETAKSLGDVEKKSHDAGTAFEFFREHLVEIISLATAVELALKGIEFGKEGLKGAADIEASLSRVKALASDGAEAFGEMQEAVEHAAKAVNVDGTQAAAALASLVSNGLSAKDAIGALVPVLQLAKIANVDVGIAAQQVADTLKSFNIPATDAQKVVDELTAASHGAAGGLGAMSSAAQQLAPDAKALGLGLTDTVSILGLLSSKGFDAEKSVRALRSVFQELSDPTSKLRGELLALGDGTGDFNKAIAALTAGTPQADRALTTLSGPARTLIELLGQAGPGAIAAFNAKLQDSGGIAEHVAKLLDDNLNGAWAGFKHAIDDIAESLAKPILAPFKDELQSLADRLRKFAESDDFKRIQDKVGDLATNAANAIDKFLTGIDWDKFLNGAENALDGVVDGMAKVAESATTIATAVNKSADVIGGAWNTAAGVVHTSAAVIAEGAADAIGHTNEFGEILHDVAGENLTQAGANFKKVGGDLVDLAGAADEGTRAVRAHGDAHKDAAPKIDQNAQAAERFKNVVAGSSTAIAQATTVMPTLTVRLGEGGTAAQTFADRLELASKQAADLKDSSGKAVSGVDAVALALNKLGASSQHDLEIAAEKAASFFATVDKNSDDTAQGLADRQNAFLGYAKAALAASAGMDVGTKASIVAMLDAKAAALDLSGAMKILEGQASQTGNALLDQAKQAEDAARDERIAREQANAAQFNAAQTAEMAGKAAQEATEKAEKGFTEWGDAADAAALATKRITIDASHANETMDKLRDGIKAAQQEFAQTSAAAKQLFDTDLQSLFELGHSDNLSGIDRAFHALADATQIVRDRIAADRVELQGMVDNINAVGTASGKGFGEFGSNASDAGARIGQMIEQIKSGNYQFDLLGKQDLGPLQQALEAAKARVQALADAAAAANQKLQDMAKAAHDALLQEKGDQAALEEERHQQVLDDLKKEAEAAGDLNSATYQQAVADENALHDLKEKNLQQQQQQQQSGGGGSSSSGNGGGTTSKPTTTTSGDAGTGAGGLSSGSTSSAGSSNGGRPVQEGDIHVGGITLNIKQTKLLKDHTDQELDEFGTYLVQRLAGQITQSVLDQLRYAKASSI